MDCSDVSDNVAAYVLGSLPELTRTEFELHIESCGSQHEVAALSEVVEFLAALAPYEEPRVDLRARIIAAAGSDAGEFAA